MSDIIKKWAVISAAWLGILIISTFLYVQFNSRDTFSVNNHVARSSDYVYVTDNGPKEGIVYQLEGTKIASYFHTGSLAYLADYHTAQIALLDEDPYVVFKKEIDDNGRDITEYAVVSFNTDMEPTAVTAPFRFDLPVELSGFSVTEDQLYFTGISDNRRMIYVYSVSASQLEPISTTAITAEKVSEWEKSEANVKEVTSQGSEGVRYYGDGVYGDGLTLRMDNELAGEFAVDTEAKTAFLSMKITPAIALVKAGVSASFVLALFACGVALIFIVCYLLYRKKRVSYMVAMGEGLVFVAFAALYILYVADGKTASENGYSLWASQTVSSVFDGYELTDLGDTSIYSSSDYGVIASRLVRMGDLDFNKQFFTKTVDIISTDNSVIFSSDGNNFDSISEKYGDEAANIISTGVSTSSIQTGWGKYEGKNAFFVAVPLSKAGLIGYGALVVAQADLSALYATSTNLIMLAVLLVLFALASAFLIFLLRAQHKDLEILQDALIKLSRGETDTQKPLVIGKDMNMTWNSIFEIQKNIRNISREKLLTYEAYYKFAPKGMEKILGLSDATEIKGNEYVSKNGTIATLSVVGDLSMRERDRDAFIEMYEDLERCRDKYNGIFVSHTNNFDLMKYLFLEEEKDTVSFGTDYVQKIRQIRGQIEGTACMLLHYTPFRYGVVGVKDQASIYMTSANSKFMDALSAWLLKMRLPLVITEDLRVHEKPDESLRYIGFVTTDDGKDLKLYEVLDALPVTVRFLREDGAKNFAEALRLFYERDFYFARNIFSEILRKSPEDQVAKWYLFECEKYLDEAVPEDYTGALHME